MCQFRMKPKSSKAKFTLSLTDSEKIRLEKLLSDLEEPDMKIPEKCRELVNDLYEHYRDEVEAEFKEVNFPSIDAENPYRIDPKVKDDWDAKLAFFAKFKKPSNTKLELKLVDSEAKKPWHNDPNREKLSKINFELRRHNDKRCSLKTNIPTAEQMKTILKECKEDDENLSEVAPAKIANCVREARKVLSNTSLKKSAKHSKPGKVVNVNATDEIKLDNAQHSSTECKEGGNISSSSDVCIGQDRETAIIEDENDEKTDSE